MSLCFYNVAIGLDLYGSLRSGPPRWE